MIEQNVKTFSDRLREYRENSRFSQVAMAQLLQVSQSQYSRWENGRHIPSKLRQVYIADRLGLPRPDLCEVPACQNQGLHSYIVNPSTIPFHLNRHAAFKILLCPEHEEQKFALGVDEFANKHKLTARLENARKLLR